MSISVLTIETTNEMTAGQVYHVQGQHNGKEFAIHLAENEEFDTLYQKLDELSDKDYKALKKSIQNYIMVMHLGMPKVA